MPDVARSLVTRTSRTLAVAVATAAVVTAANASEGAYFSQSWGWVALAFLVPASVLLLLERVALPGRLRIAFALLVGALAVWTLLSTTWSTSPAASLRDTERLLVYAAVALALATVLRRGDAPGLIAGVLLGGALVSSYALATRLLPDRLDTYDDPTLPYRLSEPLGYWNALGLLAAMSLLVALGLVAHGRNARFSAATGALLPLLAVTLYFTFSRGAWAALALGFAAMTALDPRRLRLLWSTLVVAPASVLCVAFASRQEALTTEDAPTADAVAQGHRLAVLLLVLVAASGALAWVAGSVSRRVAVRRSVARGVDVALVTAVVTTAAVAIVAVGGPSRGLSELKKRFDAEPVAGADLNARLFSVSGNGRTETIGVAWDAARERPFLGHGAGSFEYLWYERRPSLQIVRDAHSLYVEMLSEVGVVGLGALAGALVLPVLAALRARRSRLVPGALGAYLAWAAASAMDWHWEMVGVTVAALLVGGSCLLAAERGRTRALGDAARWSLVGVSVALSVVAVISLVGNQALFAGREAIARKDWRSAHDDARRAQALLFWSYEPELVLGDASAGLGGREAALAAYREAVATDPRNWAAWLRLAQVARGTERAAAYKTVRALNPLEPTLPGERSSR